MKNSCKRRRWLALSFGLLAMTATGFACSSSPTGGSEGSGGSSPTNGCTVGQERCGIACVELASDPDHCGSCNNACDAPLVCSGAACTTSCATGQTQCGTACADLDDSPNHCGGCNKPCGGAETCRAGTCVGNPAGNGGSGTGGGSPGLGGAAGGSAGGAGGSGNGGSGNGGNITVGPCNRVVTSCTEPEVRVTEIDFGVPLTPYEAPQGQFAQPEWDTLPLPAALASMPSGGTRVAARGTDGRIHVATLDCDDEMVGAPITLDAVDLQDIHADDEGGVVLLTRNAPGSGEDHCGPINTCDSSSDPCYNSFVVRFDGTGEVWATSVTNLDESQDAYENGARFIWQRYQHHGRLAFDGSNYAAYFCIGITTQGNSSCQLPGGVDIHEGDRMQMVSASGMVVNDPQEFEVGCSHSWTTRIVWDPRSSRFMMVCATDNRDPETGSSCRLAMPAPYETVAPVECGEFWGGDLVLAEGSGYWTAYSKNGSANLVHFTESGPERSIDDLASTDHPKLVSFGAGKMLLAWESGSQMRAQIYDSATGDRIGSEFDIAVEDHNYHAFKAFSDGSAAYPARGSTGTSIRVARVMACD